MSLRKYFIQFAKRLEKTWKPLDLDANHIAVSAGWYITEFNVQGSIKHIPELIINDKNNKEFRRSLIGFHSGRNRMLFYLPEGNIAAYDKALKFDFLSRVSWLEGRARVLLICARYLVDFFSFGLLFRIIAMQFQNRFELSTDILQFYYPKNYLYEIQRWKRFKGFGGIIGWFYRDIKLGVLIEDEMQFAALEDQIVQPDYIILNGANIEIPDEVDYLIPLPKSVSLREPAVAMIKREIKKQKSRPNFIYSDHDYSFVKTEQDADQQGAMEPVHKPNPSLPYLYCYNYVGPAVVYNTDLLSQADYSELFNPQWAYQFALDCFREIQRVLHIPEALFISSKITGIETPVPTSLQSQWPNINWLRKDAYNVLTADPTWSSKPSVDLIIPTRDGLDVLKPCIESILEITDYPEYQIIIVDNGSELSETKEYLSAIARHEQVAVVDFPGEFNYSAINNTAAAQASSEYIALINNDIEAIHSDWLTQMMVWATQPNVGIVGAKLLYSNGDIQHAGVTIGMGNAAGHIHRLENGNSLGYQNRLVAVQNMMAVTAACLITKRSLFEQLNGLNETEFKVAYNDIDYCLRVEKMGMDIIWTPEARLFHHESVTRGDDMSEQHITRYFHELGNLQKKWKTKGYVDKYYSKHLRISDEGVYPQVYLTDQSQMRQFN